MRRTLKPSIAKAFAEFVSTPSGRRKFGWDMTKPICPRVQKPPWEGFPNPPGGAMDVWCESRLGRGA